MTTTTPEADRFEPRRGIELSIDPRSSTPIYAQVVERVRALVRVGALRPGTRMPSVRDMAVALRINRNTAAKAYSTLEGLSVLETRPGQGTFVAAGSPQPDVADVGRLERRIDTLFHDARALGFEPQDVISIAAGRIAGGTTKRATLVAAEDA